MAPVDRPTCSGRLADPGRPATLTRLLEVVPDTAAYDRLAQLAAHLTGASAALVCLVAEDEVVLGSHGIPGRPARLPVAGSPCLETLRGGVPLVAPDAAAHPRLATLPAARSGELRGYLGVPLRAGDGHDVGVLGVFDTGAHDWSEADVRGLEQLAASVVTELELAAASADARAALRRLDVALDASQVGIWEIDLRAGTFACDARCAAIFGVEGPVTAFPLASLMERHVHPGDRAAAEESLRDAVERRAQYTVEVRNLRADGGVRWTVSRGQVLVDGDGEPVGVLGTSLDVTESRELVRQRIAAVQRTAAIAEVAAELAGATRLEVLSDVVLRGAQVLGADSSGLAVLDPGGQLRVHMSSGLVAAVRSVAPDFEIPADGVPVELDDALPTQYAARHGERVLLADPEEAVARFPAMAEVNEALGTRALAALPLRVEGRLLGAFVAIWTVPHRFLDSDLEVLEALTAQIALSVSRLQADAARDTARAAMVEANQRLQLVADAGRVLSDSLDITDQIERLADLVVPALGDWCWIVVTDDAGRLHGLASAHRDPDRRDELAGYVRAMVSGMTESAGARVVTSSGRPLVMPEIDRDRIARALPDPAVQEALVALDVSAGVVVPLLARGHALGALGLFTGAERGPHTPGEIDTAVEIGRRAGLALHQARLYGQQRALADALQRSMLTDPVQPEHCEIAVRYVPAAAGAEIGGDWYDAFRQPDGATVLAIGDVAGHDTRAAAAMGQVRGLLRGISFSGGAPPAVVLTEVDHAIHGLALDTMATALVARLETDGRPGALLRWSSAGHPPPVVLRPDGAVELLGGGPADLLLGVTPETRRSDRTTRLAPGTTVLLHTDGLVERRDRDIDAGTAALVEVLGRCAGMPLAQLCDTVLDDLFLPDAEDDVAVLAVRLLDH